MARPYDALTSALYTKRAHRITRYRIALPSAPPPYTAASGYASITDTRILSAFASYEIESSDDLAADKATFTMPLVRGGAGRDIVDWGDLLMLEEEYTSGSGVCEWFTVGTFLVTGIEEDASPAAGVLKVSCTGTLRKLSATPFVGHLSADKIRMARRALRFVEGPSEGKTYYKFIDGEVNGARNYNWCESPVPRVWLDDGRLRYKEGGVDLLYGSGELYIEAEFFTASEEDGGLHIPAEGASGGPVAGELFDRITCEYERYATEADVAETSVTATLYADATLSCGLTLGMEASASWVGCSATVTSGAAEGKMYAIVAVSGSDLRLASGCDPEADGVLAGDTLRVVETNRLDNVLLRILRDAGFQNADAAKPFYIKSIERPVPDIFVPSGKEFRFLYEDNINHLGVVERIRQYLPASYMVYNEPDGSVVCGSVGQSEPADAYAVPMLARAELNRASDEIYTAVRYTVRMQDYRNIANPTVGELLYVTVGGGAAYPSGYAARGSALDAENDAIEGENAAHHAMGEGGPFRGWASQNARDGAKRIVDGSIYTCAEWYCSENRCFGNSRGAWEDMWLAELAFKEEHKLLEVHITPSNVEHLYGLSLALYYSTDGLIWETLADEFKFDSASAKVLSDMPDVAIKYIRVRCIMPACWTDFEKNLFIFQGRAWDRLLTGFSEIGVYKSDIVEGWAYLGVDRFDATGTIAAIGALDETLTLTGIAAEAHLAGKTLTVYHEGSARTYGIVGVADGVLTVSGSTPVSELSLGDKVVAHEGESEADFNTDKILAARLGRRVYNVPAVDEYGYYIAQEMDPDLSIKDALARYARMRAMEWLAEKERVFSPLSLSGVRPDVAPRKTILASVPALGIGQATLYVSSVTRGSGGLGSITATNYKVVNH